MNIVIPAGADGTELTVAIDGVTYRAARIDSYHSLWVANMAVYESKQTRQPWQFGVSDQYAAEASNLNASAGENTLNLPAIAANTVVVVTHVDCVDVNNAATFARLRLVISTIILEIAAIAPGGANRYLMANGWWVLREGDNVRAVLEGCTSGDDLYLRASGFKMTSDALAP